MADDQIGPALDKIKGKVGALDGQVSKHQDAFGQAMKSNRDNAFSFGDGLEQVAGRIHPALGGIVSEVRKIGSSLATVKSSRVLGEITSDVGAFHAQTNRAGAGTHRLLGMFTQMSPGASSGLRSLTADLGG